MAKKIVHLNQQKVGDITKRVPTVTRPGLVKKLLGQFMNNSFTLNMGGVIALLPVMFVVMLYINIKSGVQYSLPYSSVLGVGYPAISDVFDIAFVTQLSGFMQSIVTFLPIAALVSVYLLVAVMYTARNFAWTEGELKVKDFFRSFKFNAVQSIFIALIAAVITLLISYAIYLYKIYVYSNGVTFISVLVIISLSFVALVSVIFVLYAIALSITYKLSLGDVLYAAMSLTFSNFLQNVLIVIAMFAPIALAFISTFFSTFVLMFFIFLGIAYDCIVWTVYSQYVFDVITSADTKKNVYHKAEKSKT